MFFANYILKDKVTKIRTQHKNMKLDKDTLDSEKSKAYTSIYDMKLALEELRISTNDNSYRSYTSLLDSKLSEIKATDDMLELLEILNQILTRFEDMDFDCHVYTSSYYREYNSSKRIQKDFIRNVAAHIATERNFNVFDACCRDGNILKTIKEVKPNAICYGLEENNNFAEKAKEHATKIIKGTIKGSRIKNEAFDLLIANCSFGSTLKDNMSFGSVVKQERSYLQNMCKYLSPQGIIIIGIPYYRLYKDMCTMIARQFENVTIVKGYGDENDNLHMVYIIGQKSSTKNIDEEIYNKLRVGYDYNNIPSAFSTSFDNFKLSNLFQHIDMFKGSVLDMEELYSIVETSGNMKTFIEKQSVSKIHENTKKPLLPFNIGQIGLVLTSGCLDGIIDEGDGHYHLVKGRVSKKSEVTRETSDGILEEKEVLSNRVEINVILPNGEFKTLA